MFRRKRRYVCVRCGWRHALRRNEHFPALNTIPPCLNGGHLCFRDSDHSGIGIGLSQARVNAS